MEFLNRLSSTCYLLIDRNGPREKHLVNIVDMISLIVFPAIKHLKNRTEKKRFEEQTGPCEWPRKMRSVLLRFVPSLPFIPRGYVLSVAFLHASWHLKVKFWSFVF